jgi:hypothetical protein
VPLSGSVQPTPQAVQLVSVSNSVQTPLQQKPLATSSQGNANPSPMLASQLQALLMH